MADAPRSGVPESLPTERAVAGNDQSWADGTRTMPNVATFVWTPKLRAACEALVAKHRAKLKELDFLHSRTLEVLRDAVQWTIAREAQPPLPRAERMTFAGLKQLRTQVRAEAAQPAKDPGAVLLSHKLSTLSPRLVKALGSKCEGPILAAIDDRMDYHRSIIERLQSNRPDIEVQKLTTSILKRISDLEAETNGADKRLRRLQARMESTSESIERKIKQRLAKDRTPSHDQDAARRSILENTALYPAIDDLVASEKSLRREYDDLTSAVQSLQEARSRLAETEKIVARLSKNQPRSEPPPKMVVLEWSQAEELARDFLIWLGYRDARVTACGADGGVDIDSSKAVGQVKMHNKGVGRPDVQQLFGIGAAERKQPVFFAFSYTAEATAWATTHDVPLYRFARSGEVTPATPAARALMTKASP